MKTFAEVSEWIAGAKEEMVLDLLGREPITQCFFRWVGDISTYVGKELVCGRAGRDVVLQFLPKSARLAVPLAIGEPQYGEDGGVEIFGAEQLTAALWSLRPSLHVPGVIHTFVVLYQVPDPAPWQRMIWLPGDVEGVSEVKLL
jgi:hypothetical protein